MGSEPILIPYKILYSIEKLKLMGGRPKYIYEAISNNSGLIRRGIRDFPTVFVAVEMFASVSKSRAIPHLLKGEGHAIDTG